MNDEKKNDKEMIINKLKIFFSEKISVHLVLSGGEWANGDIKEICDTYIILTEFKKGDLPILFEEIIDVDKYTPKEVRR
jgi:hypothetical protein